jgi:hypothetical protein
MAVHKVTTRNVQLYRDPAVLLIDQLKHVYIASDRLGSRAAPQLGYRPAALPSVIDGPGSVFNSTLRCSVVSSCLARQPRISSAGRQ